jgi:hypothetical protein
VVAHRLLIEGVHLRRLGGSAGGDYLFGDDLGGREVPPVEKTVARSSAKVRATAPPIPPPAP